MNRLGHMAYCGSDNRKTPWYSTETWIRWFDKYGASDPDALAQYTRYIWNIIAGGGNGFNLYMFHGGSNFDYWNDNSSGASYDYGTLIGEGGDLRNLYYSVKRAGTFATSFPDILDDSTNATSTYSKFATGRDVPGKDPTKSTPSIVPFARTSPAGTVVFIRNMQKTPETATLQSGQTLNLDPLEVVPVLVNTPLAPGIRAKLAVARTLGLATHGATSTWIVYGKPEEKGHLELDLDQDGTFVPGASTSAFQVNSSDAKHPMIDITFSENAPQELLLKSGGQTLRILAETPAWTDRTWLVGERGAQDVITGLDYVGDFTTTAGKARFTVARNFGNPPLKVITLYSDAPKARQRLVTDPVTADDTSAPALDPWQMAKAVAQAAPDFADSTWLAGNQPPQLGADGDPTAYGWYRASFDAPTAGAGKLSAGFEDRAVIFLNGKLVGSIAGRQSIGLNVNTGHNSLAVFLSHIGRPKALDYVDKPLAIYEPRGILGTVTLTVGTQAVPITGWKLHGGISAPNAPELSWESPAATNLGAPTFFRTSFQAKAPTVSGPRPIYRVSTKGLSRGSVWLNGHNLGRYPLKLDVDGLYLPECWLKDGANSLVIFDEEGHVPTPDVHLWCEKAASREIFQVQE
jgi:beta-galactosidase